MPGVRYTNNKICASSFEALGLSVKVSRAFVLQVIVDIVALCAKSIELIMISPVCKPPRSSQTQPLINL